MARLFAAFYGARFGTRKSGPNLVWFGCVPVLHVAPVVAVAVSAFAGFYVAVIDLACCSHFHAFYLACPELPTVLRKFLLRVLLGETIEVY